MSLVILAAAILVLLGSGSVLRSQIRRNRDAGPPVPAEPEEIEVRR
jgi:hypothetical protein